MKGLEAFEDRFKRHRALRVDPTHPLLGERGARELYAPWRNNVPESLLWSPSSLPQEGPTLIVSAGNSLAQNNAENEGGSAERVPNDGPAKSDC